MFKLEILIDGEKKLEKEIRHVKAKQIVKTIEMIVDYASKHRGSKIRMLQGIKGLK